MPRLSVVIPTLGRREVLAMVLAGLARQRDVTPGDFEVVLVADADEPDKGGLDELLGDRPFPTLRLAGPRPGASAARNAGWRAARAPVVLFLGADILPARRLVAEHLAWHDRHAEPEVAVLGAVRWARGIHVTPFMRWLDEGIQFDYTNIGGIEAAPAQLYTANVSLKTEVLERVGGFDEDEFPFLYEDLDLGLRLGEHGLRLLLNRAAEGGHHHPSTVEDWERRMALIAAAERRFVRRWPDMPAYFHDLLADAASAPPASGRGRYLARLVPRRVPGLGDYVWNSVDVYYRQRLAPAFMAAWTSADPGGPPGRAPRPAAG